MTQWHRLTLGIGLLPLILILFYGIDVPYNEEWGLAGLLSQGWNFSFHDFAATNNEHRVYFPKLYLLSLAHLTSWNIRAELVCNWGLALIGAMVLTRRWVNGLSTTEGRAPIFFWLVAMLAYFSWAQWENWLWGWEAQWFMAVSAAIIAFFFLERVGYSPGFSLALAIIAAFVSQFSSAQGILVWIAGSIILYLNRCPPKIWLLWLGAALITTALYLYGFTKPENTPSFWYVFQHPLLAIRYVGYFLGGIFPRGILSQILGLSMVALFVGLATVLLRFSGQRSHRAAFWFALGAFAIMTGMLSALGRAGWSVSHGGASRFALMSGLLAVSIVGLLQFARQEKLSLVTNRRVMGALLMIFLVFFTWGEIKSFKKQRKWSHTVAEGALCAKEYQTASDECLAKVRRNFPDQVRANAPILERLGYSLFAERHRY